ncbi:MAG: histone deacetylase [Candidatus Omnitrophica bacterium]|nr:histone deacetylase [Candidatus Omnitrophota bacterium]
MEIFFRKELLEYYEPGHPESPQRLEAIISFLEKKGITNFLGFEEVLEPLVAEVHSHKHINTVKNNNFFDPDTPNFPGIYRYAMLASGGAVAAAKTALNKKDAFALIRPPGHHAGKDFLGGFCYFNNIAIAVKYCLKSIKRVAILDLDGHHGNGTESIFRESKQVLFISIHQSHCYPWTGLMSFSNCYNFPVRKGINFSDYKIFLFESIVLINKFTPEVVAISMGFDTHKNDPLLDLQFSDSDYYHMARIIGQGISVPTFFVLEGGYDIKSIGNSFYCFLSGWEKCRR